MRRTILSLLAVAVLLAGCEFDIVGPPPTGFGPRPVTLLGDFEREADLVNWRAAPVWGRRAEGAVSLSEEHATSGERSLAVKVPAGRTAAICLSNPPADWRPYESLVFDVFTPKIADTEEWVPFSLFIENTQSADWFSRVHHDSRLGVVSGRRSTIEVPLREIQVFNLRRERFGVAEIAGGFDGIESPMGMLSRRFDISTITSLELRFTGIGADRTFFIDNVRLSKSPNFDGPVATTPSTVRVGSPYRYVSFDLNKGGALCDLLGNRTGPEFRITGRGRAWRSSAAGTNHATIKILESTPERIRIRVTGGLFGPWPRPGVDLGSTVTFEYTIEKMKGESFPKVTIDASFRRNGPALEGVESMELVWRCGQSPVVAGVAMKPGETAVARAFIAGSRLAFGGKRWLALASKNEVRARYVPSFNDEHELVIPVRLGAGGRIEQGAEYRITLTLQTVL